MVLRLVLRVLRYRALEGAWCFFRGAKGAWSLIKLNFFPFRRFASCPTALRGGLAPREANTPAPPPSTASAAGFPYPAVIGEMAVTPQVLAEYAGHEIFLKQRARHTPECYERYDAVRDCLLRRERDEKKCEYVLRTYRPCARQAHKAQVAASIASDEERRKLLNAKARVIEAQGKDAT